MIKNYSFNKNSLRIILLLLTTLLLAPIKLFGQNGGNKNDVYIVLTCTEYVGDGTLVAHFGYENTGKKTVVVDENGSVVTYNHGQAKKNGIYSFEPGVHEYAFTQEFDSKDRVEWTVEFPDGTTKTTDANISSNHCKDLQSDLNIIPGYYPPEGGKEYNSKIGAELTALHEAYTIDPSLPDAPGEIFQLAGSKVLIEAVSYLYQYESMLASLSSVVFDLETSDPALNRATGWVEIADLLLLNALDPLNYARPVYPGVGNYVVPATGLTKSQGDFAMHSDFVRLGYAVDGAGVKIGVLSNSYDTRGEAAQDVLNGDLPGAGNPNGDVQEVQVLKDIVPTHGTLSDEGRAMLQIVHDIAPGAQLAFRTGFLGEQDMANGIRELADAGTDIIVDDLSYITEPFFRDGIISQAIDEVVSQGVTFFSSAGNFGKTAYTAVYDEEPAPATISGTAHDFSGDGDIFQSILLPEGNYTLVMQWDDGSDPTMNTTTTDLDIFLSDDVGFSLLGFNRENVGGFPIEVVPFSVLGDSVYANVVVSRASGSAPVTFKYMLFRGGSQFQILEYGTEGSSTIVGHPNAAGAISVGAVRFDKNPVYNPAEYPVPVIMSFSSMGGTPVNGVVRSKPDITAPNGVNTTVDLGNGDWVSPIDPDTLFPNFFGTSAASPHAAGMAALILEAKSVFESGSSMGPEDIRSLMKSTAIDMDAPGEDFVSGSGFIQAHKALLTFANPSPYVENLILASEGAVPGTEITPFSFTITGDFFTDDTEVWIRGEALDSGVEVVDESTITVNHEGFIGNPEIQVYTPPISSSTADGGFSDTVYFSDPVRQRVIITADDKTKKFGEVIPEFTASFVVETVDGASLTLAEAVSGGIMLQAEADRLSGLTYSVPASSSSDADQYIIVPSLDPVLNITDPQTEIDYAITEKYILEYVNGTLTVEKLALTITPVDVQMTYGQQLPVEGFDFIYELGDSGVVIDNPAVILSGVEQEHLAALTNDIALVRGVALVNGVPVVRGTALVNGTTLLRGVALVNGVEVKVEVENGDTTVYVAGEPLVNGGTLVRGVALVNNRPFVSMTEIVRGVALVNGDEVTFDEGYMTEINGVPLENAVPAVRGVALVNGLNSRGLALVNGITIEVDENGVTYLDGQAVDTELTAVVNGITVLRGTALVNSSTISRGVALVNGLRVVMENGVPTGRGIALVNGVSTLRGVALVNGLPLIRGTALVNNLEVHVDDGEVGAVYENGALVNGLTLSRGLALVNGIALVNGGQLISRGTALVNGIALSDDQGDGEEIVNLANMNFMASAAALANGLNSLRGTALVNGLESEDGEALRVAAGTVQEDGSIVFENGYTSRGVALVNGLNYVRGTALVNGSPLNLRGTALVNSSTISDSSNNGTILVFDATELGETSDEVGFTPISFITGTTVGQHWIVPGTYISNNFDISYGLGTLTIDPADLSITAEDKTKVFGEEDPPLTFTTAGLLGTDALTGELIRDAGEDAGDYTIRQGSVTAGDNYTVLYDSATLSIQPAVLAISITAESKVYDGSAAAAVALSDDRLDGSDLDISYTSALFADKQVGEGKVVTVLGLALAGADAGNYTANTEATTTADITPRDLVIAISADDKTYDGSAAAATYATISEGLVEDDDVQVASSNGVFDDKNVGADKPVTAEVSTAGADAGNYAANTEAATTASITAKDLLIAITADDKTYDGSAAAATYASIFSGMVSGDVLTVSSSNGTFSDKNVGNDKPVTADVSTAGADAANYVANTVASTTASITAKELVVSIEADNKVYDGNTTAVTTAAIYSGLMDGDQVEVSSFNGAFNSKHVGTGKTVTADIGTSGADAGNYANNTVATTLADISAAALVIGIQADDKVYDGDYLASTSAYVLSGMVDGDALTVSSSNGLFADKNVGTWNVSADVYASGADAGNYTANNTAAATAEIMQLEVSVIPESGFLYIREGDPLPVMAFIYNGWIAGDAGNEGYTVLRDSDGASYDPNSSESAGSYTVTPVPSNSNYIFTIETGILHVNPYGPGTRAVKPVLNCIQEIDTDYFVANFEYRNDNDVDVYIPLGEDNFLTGTGIDWENSDPVPTMFVSGGGSFRVFFDGSELSWIVSSRDEDQTVSNAAEANSSSTKCKGNPKSTGSFMEGTISNELDPDQLLAYPNPVIEKVYLSLKGIENYEMIKLYDFAGRSHPITSIDKRTDRLEIDMAGLPAGHYVVSVVMEDSTRVVQLIKQ